MSAVPMPPNEHEGPAPDGLHTGDLFQRYRPQDELGRGPVATVYRAMDEESGRPVALKLFDAHFRREPRFAIRFRRHLQTVVGLHHDHVVAVRDYGLAGDHFYIATEFVDGLNLATLLTERGVLSPAAAAYVARQTCFGLAAAHEHGLVHRNLKPENVLLAEDGQVKIADVGLSGLLSESGLSQTSVMLNGAGYMAPEQGRGLTAGPAADVYSAGVILFEMLTGRPPFASADIWQVVHMHLRTAPPSPRDLNPDVPSELATVVGRALHKEPNDRFASAAAMSSALAPLAAGVSSIELPPAKPRAAAGRRPTELPVILHRAGRRVRRLVANLTVTDGPRRLRLSLFLLVLQFIVTFTIALLLLLPLSGMLFASSSPAAADGDQNRRLIAKPLPPAPTATTTATPTATPTPEPSPTVAAAGQPPAGSSEGSGWQEGGPPPWAGGPPPWAGGPGGRGRGGR